MAANLSVLVRPYGATHPQDFDICDRRYGTNLDIPRCDVAVARLDSGPARIPYRISDQEGGCMVSVEVAGPHLPQTYSLIPDVVQSLASHVINECVGKDGRSGGFATLDLGRLIDFVLNPSTAFPANYPSSTTFLTVSITSSDKKNPSPGNYDPIIADTLAGAARDAAMHVPAASAVRKRLVERAQWFRRRAMRMSTGGSTWPWWG
ncbi:MAG: hypothetical protein Q9200_007721 [Gallowayella weberi]